MFSFGSKAMKTKQEKIDITKYGDNSASGDVDEDLKKNKDALLNTVIEGGKVAGGAYDDTGFGAVLDKLGVFDAGGKDKSKNIEEENKIKSDLENSGLSSDPLTVGISKIIKKKIENNSAPGTSSEEIDDMLIEIMQDVEEEVELISSEDDSDDESLEDIENIIDIASDIDQILETNSKLADQKIIDLKNNLNKAESEKKYLEGIVKAYEDAEKKGGILSNAQGISAIKKRLEDAEKTINDLRTELQKYGYEQEENTDDENTEDKEIEDDLTDEKESEEIIEEVIEEVIVLNGTLSDANGGGATKMSMTINIKTGTVSGIIFIRINNDGLKLNMDVPIFGSMNLETRVINAKSGEMKLSGLLSADSNSANGTASSEEGSGVWSVSR